MTTERSAKSSPTAKSKSTATNAATSTKSPSAEATLTRFQSHTPKRVHRSMIKNAPYNPRQIDEHNKEKLRKKLKTRGLIEAPTWNELSGNLVGGHQRLAIIDALEGHSDYLIDVCAVELTETEEIEENIALNNPNLQGDWDLALMGEIMKREDFKLEPTGFDNADVQIMFEDSDLSTMFEPSKEAKELIDNVETQQAAAKDPKKTKTYTGPEKEFVERWKAESDTLLDTELYSIVIFKSREDREQFMRSIGLTKEDRYVDGARVKAHFDPELLIP